MLAGDDEYHDSDTSETADWFRSNLRSKRAEIEIIPGALHSFNGQEAKIVASVRRWIKKMNALLPSRPK